MCIRDSTHPAQGAELRAHLEILAYFLGTAPEEAHEEGLDLDAMSPRVLRVAVRRAFLLLVQGLLARTVDDRPAVFVVTGADAMDVPTRDALRFCARLLGNRARVILLSACLLYTSRCV